MQTKMSHAYILSGPPDAALSLAAAMVCEGEAAPCGECPHCRKALRGIHPDIVVVAPPEGKRELSVDQIREVTQSSAVAPNEADVRVFIIDGADTMNASCQNALLKLLEEPPAHVALILRAQE
ncbi:MAG: DNA polymerase III subunit delta, partial [Oscillospiraceae bacterium]|nr:DNA polymerase III subunit delta [Oscillospiraceae bacterium]